MLESLHKKSMDRDPALRTIMAYIKRDLNRQITVNEFTTWAHTYPSVLTPLRMLQTHLRFQIIGPTFWTRMTQERRGHPEMGKIDYLPQLQKRVIAQNKYFANQGDIDAQERRRLSRRGRGPNGDHRDDITRKESVLVSYFKLSRFSLRRTNPQRAVVPEYMLQAGVAPAAPAPIQDDNMVGALRMRNKPILIKMEPRRRRSSFLLAIKPKLVMEATSTKKKSSKKHKREAAHEAIDHSDLFDSKHPPLELIDNDGETPSLVSSPEVHSHKEHNNNHQSHKSNKMKSDKIKGGSSK